MSNIANAYTEAMAQNAFSAQMQNTFALMSQMAPRDQFLAMHAEQQRRDIAMRQAMIADAQAQAKTLDTAALFWKLPEVAYLVDKIPAARIILKPDAIILRDLGHAKEVGLPLRQQCADLCIAWSARFLKAAVVHEKTVAAIDRLPPSIASQTVPDTLEEAIVWADHVNKAHRLNIRDDCLAWVAHNACKLRSTDALDWLAGTQTVIAKGTSPKRVREKSDAWHRARHERDLDLMRLMYEPAFGRAFLLPGRSPNEPVKEKKPPPYRSVTVDDFDIVRMHSQQDFSEESAEMRHCISSYYSRYHASDDVFLSVRKHGKRVATVWLSGSWDIHEAKGKANSQAPEGAMQAVRWLAERKGVTPDDMVMIAEEKPKGFLSRLWTGRDA